MKVRFWGVRGNVVMPGPYTIRYGGNTSCIEIRGDNNELLIIDAGTGLRELGMYLTAHDFKQGPIDANILLTHAHWDHMQGFPFFAPVIFIPQNQITFYGPVSDDDNLENVISGQMNYSYFPVKLDELKAKIRFRNIGEGNFQIGEFEITTKYLNHPVPALAYRIQYKDKVVVTMYDTEPYGNDYKKEGMEQNPAIIDEYKRIAREKNEELVDFARGADLLIHDSQYTKEEYFESRIGWGHSYFEYAVENGAAADVKMLALFHLEYEDDKIDALERMSKQYGADINKDMIVFCAREQLEIEI